MLQRTNMECRGQTSNGSCTGSPRMPFLPVQELGLHPTGSGYTLHKCIQISCCGLEGTWGRKYKNEWTFCMWPLKRVLHCSKGCNVYFQQEFGWLWLTNQIVLSLLIVLLTSRLFLFLQIWKMKISSYEMRISHWRITLIAFYLESLAPARKSWRSKVNLLQGGADLYWDLCRLTTSLCVCVCVCCFQFCVCSMSVEWWTGILTLHPKGAWVWD